MADLRVQSVAATNAADPGTFTPEFEDQIIVSGTTFYRATGTSAGNVVSALAAVSSGYFYGNTSPIGNVTPNAVNELFIYEESQTVPYFRNKLVFYLSTGLTNTDWTVIDGTAWVTVGDTIPSPIGNNTPDFIGQIWVNGETNPYSGISIFTATGLTNADWVSF